jgi:hypothetical protein
MNNVNVENINNNNDEEKEMILRKIRELKSCVINGIIILLKII